jgi:glycosyltransferase involved in cell wall biosynthesis
MKILLSAYACEPGKGSEPGVGWHWATELAYLGHEVAVITRSNNRESIEMALTEVPIAGLHFYYYDLPSWGKWWKRGPRGVQLYYFLWQQGAYQLARILVKNVQFDLVHHVTFGVFRQPSFMGALGIPFVIGPIGGGEITPNLLRRTFPAKQAFREILRELSNKLAYINPSVSAMYRQATVIFCKTQNTLDILPAASRGKSRLHLEIGLEPDCIRREVIGERAKSDFLYAGSLVYWKGLHLALKAFSLLLKERPRATFSVIGRGPDEDSLKSLSRDLGLQSAVRWIGWVPQKEIWTHYCRYTAFVYPSLHDSSGNVLLEAMSQALPVICLDTGGPGVVIPPSCGIKIPVENQTEAQVINNLASAMQKLTDNPKLCGDMGIRALEVARASTWRKVVVSAYAEIQIALAGTRESLTDRKVKNSVRLPK